MHNRAVSNTLGFIVIFSLVLFSLALVSTAGLNGLQDTRDATMSLNAEQSMQSLGNAMEDVYRDNESRRTASMRLGRGTLEPGSSTTTITVEDTSNGEILAQEEFDPIVYRLGDTRIVYEGSAIIRVQEGGTRIVRPPSFVFNEDEAIVPVVNTTAASDGSVGGTTAQVRLRRTGGETNVSTSSRDIEIKVDSTRERREAWERALKTLGEDECSTGGSGSTVTCEKTDIGTVIARSPRIEYTIEG